MSRSWLRWLDRIKKALGKAPERKPGRARTRVVLDVEALEERAVPAIYTVTGTADSTAAISGGTGTSADPFQAPSLRSAILAANASSQANTIILPAGTYQLTLTGSNETFGSTGDLDITEDLTILGAGAGSTIIDASPLAQQGSEPQPDRVIHIHAPTARPSGLTGNDVSIQQGLPTVTLQGMTIEGGNAPGNDARGGGILNEGDLNVINCVVTNNQAIGNSFQSGRGGGIFSRSNGKLTVTSSTITANLAQGGFNSDGDGGGIYDDYGGTVNITSSTVSNNHGFGGGEGSPGQGGGLYTLNGTAVIQNSTFSGNQARGGPGSSSSSGYGGYGGSFGGLGQGGGLYSQSGRLLLVQSSTFSDNLAQGGDSFSTGGDGRGGGIGIGNNTTNFTISNSTISGNKAIGGGFSGGEGFGGNAEGGGIYSDSSTTVNNTTIAFNEADGGTHFSQAQSVSANGLVGSSPNDGFGQGGGYFDAINDPASFASTIIAKNTVSGGNGTAGPDVRSFGSIQSNGFNLIGIGDGSQGGFNASTDQVGTAPSPIDPLLGPLQNNGGPTATHALLLGSPAINKGANPDNLGDDQRAQGFPRTVGPQTDVGAFEVQTAILATVFTNFSSKVLVLGSNVTTTGQSTLLPDTLYVNGLYHQLLGRAPDQAGVNGWVFLLEAGFSRFQVATTIWKSPEHRGLEVDIYYQQFLHRASDPAGRAAFVGAFLAGAGENDVALAFLLSAEYQNAHASDAAFVTGLYTDVLGRSPNPGEVTPWVTALGSGTTRAAVIKAFLNSSEFDGDVIAQFYLGILGRPASQTEVQAWVAFVQSGGTLEAAGELILASNEYFAHPI